MKNKIYIILLLLFSIVTTALGQTDNKFLIKVTNEKTFDLPSGLKTADFEKNIIISFSGNVPNDLTLALEGATQVSKTENVFELKADPENKEVINIEFSAKDYTKNSLSITNIKKEPILVDGTYKYYYDQFIRKTDTYNREKNEAYYYFDENGLLLSLAPVNVDADDYLIVSMIVPEDSKMSIQVIGDYNASDLNIRPYEAINPIAQSGKSGIKYVVITKTFGPFTSEKAKIKFFDGPTELSNNFDVRINKLYHVAIGASFVSSELEKPEFDIFPLGDSGNNTINTINGGKRTLVTFNVIFYWKSSVDWIMGKLKGKSHITTGRDILKEATFWERLNPTFGVAINSEWKENFFFGGNFEFVRGGSISAGWHYGRVQKLADKDFVLGETTFSGSKDDIKLTDTWKTGFFVGITLDTRIFNKVLARN